MKKNLNWEETITKMVLLFLNTKVLKLYRTFLSAFIKTTDSLSTLKIDYLVERFYINCISISGTSIF